MTPELVNPVGESRAAEEQPACEKQKRKGAAYDYSEEIIAPKHHLLAELAAKAAAEYIRDAGQVAREGKQQGGYQGTAEGHDGSLEEREVPTAGNETHADRDKYHEKGETPETKKIADKQMPQAISHLATGIAHRSGAIHHGRIPQKAHVLLPVEQIGNAGNQDEQAEHGDGKPEHDLGVAALLVIPVPPDADIVQESTHFFLAFL